MKRKNHLFTIIEILASETMNFILHDQRKRITYFINKSHSLYRPPTHFIALTIIEINSKYLNGLNGAGNVPKLI